MSTGAIIPIAFASDKRCSLRIAVKIVLVEVINDAVYTLIEHRLCAVEVLLLLHILLLARKTITATFDNDLPEVLHDVAFRRARGEAKLSSLDNRFVEGVKVFHIVCVSDDLTILGPDEYLASGLIRLKIHVLLSHKSDELDNVNPDVVQPSLNQQRVYDFNNSADNDEIQCHVNVLLERRNFIAVDCIVLK